jgi:CTP-dependent riboflavin kinase
MFKKGSKGFSECNARRGAGLYPEDRAYEKLLDQPTFYRVKKQNDEGRDIKKSHVDHGELKKVSNGYDDIVDMDVTRCPDIFKDEKLIKRGIRTRINY